MRFTMIAGAARHSAILRGVHAVTRYITLRSSGLICRLCEFKMATNTHRVIVSSTDAA